MTAMVLLLLGHRAEPGPAARALGWLMAQEGRESSWVYRLLLLGVKTDESLARWLVLVDGIVGMEGNGPIQGTPKPAAVIVAGSDLPAVDATCRIMGIAPAKIDYLRMADTQGTIERRNARQVGERADALETCFQLLSEFRPLEYHP